MTLFMVKSYDFDNSNFKLSTIDSFKDLKNNAVGFAFERNFLAPLNSAPVTALEHFMEQQKLGHIMYANRYKLHEPKVNLYLPHAKIWYMGDNDTLSDGNIVVEIGDSSIRLGSGDYVHFCEQEVDKAAEYIKALNLTESHNRWYRVYIAPIDKNSMLEMLCISNSRQPKFKVVHKSYEKKFRKEITKKTYRNSFVKDGYLDDDYYDVTTTKPKKRVTQIEWIYKPISRLKGPKNTPCDSTSWKNTRKPRQWVSKYGSRKLCMTLKDLHNPELIHPSLYQYDDEYYEY